ncbi:uncharacterized protein Dwil_GK21537 [Drosophila willistoni]|uniref:GK21537 n=1 Tax=Drosophila willistoni TaxID=7260 RepID=B4MPU5_DROWI|nr:probable cytochrome P450 6u1 [Drosophila willistoni]EDW74134.1 uncharacterized protein Dwil_GK21537 [Drosophila willistoni]
MYIIHRILLTGLSTCLLLYIAIKYTLGYWKRRGLLHEKPKFLWGNLKGVIQGKRHVQEALLDVYKAFKGRAPFIGFYACLKPFLLVTDLDLVRNILITNSGNFTTRGMYNNLKGEPLTGNLLQLDGHKWRALHGQTVEVFTSSNLQKLLSRLIAISHRSQQKMGQFKLKNVNISQLVDNYNIDVIACMTFGMDLAADKEEFRQMSQRLWHNFSLWRAYLALEFPFLASIFQYKNYDDKAVAYFYNLTLRQLEEQRRRDRQPLQSFLQLYSRSESPLSDKEIAAQAFGFIVAGLNPLNATLSFCLYELAQQTELQERTRAEIAAVLKRHNGQLTADGLKELQFTKQVVQETLRLHSPYPFVVRRCTKEFEVDNSVFVIARGNNIIIPTVAIHRDPSIYEEPLRFDPSRFDAAALKSRPAMSFLPFGAGLRGCLASQLAEQQLIVGLVALLQQHRYAPCADTTIPLKYDTKKLLLMPKSDIYLSVEREES